MNIAVADDEKLILCEMVYIVNEAIPDSKIDAFGDSEKLLESAKKKNYDIAFLDIQMPKITGVELAKKLKEINPKINIIFVTSYSEYTNEAIRLHASGYLKKPVTVEEIKNELDNLLYPVADNQKQIYVQTFGNFCVFVDGKPVHFQRDREAELLAYLVDRRGAAISRKEIASILFEEGDFSRSQQIYLSLIAHDLLEDLEKSGAEGIFVKRAGMYYVDTSKFSCDSYDFLSGNANGKKSFSGEYLEQYSWAEYLKDKFYS